MADFSEYSLKVESLWQYFYEALDSEIPVFPMLRDTRSFFGHSHFDRFPTRSSRARLFDREIQAALGLWPPHQPLMERRLEGGS